VCRSQLAPELGNADASSDKPNAITHCMNTATTSVKTTTCGPPYRRFCPKVLSDPTQEFITLGTKLAICAQRGYRSEYIPEHETQGRHGREETRHRGFVALGGEDDIVSISSLHLDSPSSNADNGSHIRYA